MSDQLPLNSVKEKKLKDLVNQDGLRLSNCYYCKVEKREKELVKYSPKSTKESKQGDMLLICKECYDKIIANRGNRDA